MHRWHPFEFAVRRGLPEDAPGDSRAALYAAKLRRSIRIDRRVGKMKLSDHPTLRYLQQRLLDGIPTIHAQSCRFARLGSVPKGLHAVSPHEKRFRARIWDGSQPGALGIHALGAAPMRVVTPVALRLPRLGEQIGRESASPRRLGMTRMNARTAADKPRVCPGLGFDIAASSRGQRPWSLPKSLKKGRPGRVIATDDQKTSRRDVAVLRWRRGWWTLPMRLRARPPRERAALGAGGFDGALIGSATRSSE